VTFEEMEVGHPGAGVKRLNSAMTVVVCTAAVAIPYWVDRALHRWWEANRLLDPVGTRMRRMLTRYRARRDSLADGAMIVAAIAEMIDASRPPSRLPAGSSSRGPDRKRKQA
jgi:hypothetical protein